MLLLPLLLVAGGDVRRAAWAMRTAAVCTQPELAPSAGSQATLRKGPRHTRVRRPPSPWAPCARWSCLQLCCVATCHCKPPPLPREAG
ncbi:MAG: hypothetical protein J3K34DRAFT_436060 [Monoraphidium minutum]|nr:MAG: hypothetical protein J3K34DRAFT_436060 [Monoraphidium minutum]